MSGRLLRQLLHFNRPYPPPAGGNEVSVGFFPLAPVAHGSRRQKEDDHEGLSLQHGGPGDQITLMAEPR